MTMAEFGRDPCALSRTACWASIRNPDRFRVPVRSSMTAARASWLPSRSRPMSKTQTLIEIAMVKSAINGMAVAGVFAIRSCGPLSNWALTDRHMTGITDARAAVASTRRMTRRSARSALNASTAVSTRYPTMASTLSECAWPCRWGTAGCIGKQQLSVADRMRPSTRALVDQRMPVPRPISNPSKGPVGRSR